jgi:hypothetical protein
MHRKRELNGLSIPIPGLTLVSEDQVGAEYTANQSPDKLSERTAITADEPLPGDPFLKAMSDWSGTGRGSHVEFEHHEIVPLQQGQSVLIIDCNPSLKPV